MNKSIKTYEDLLEEEQRLQAQLDSYKLLIREDISGLKDSLNPVKRVVRTAKNMFTMEDNGPLVNFGLNFGMDVLIRKILLARAGWVTKFVVPFVVKNFASHVIGEEDRDKIAKSIRKLVKKFTSKREQKPVATSMS
jgi:hypothetical protein